MTPLCHSPSPPLPSAPTVAAPTKLCLSSVHPRARSAGWNAEVEFDSNGREPFLSPRRVWPYGRACSQPFSCGSSASLVIQQSVERARGM